MKSRRTCSRPYVRPNFMTTRRATRKQPAFSMCENRAVGQDVRIAAKIKGRSVTTDADISRIRHEQRPDPRGPLERALDTAVAKGWRLLVLATVAAVLLLVLARL
jgi:hypothetical protein